MKIQERKRCFKYTGVGLTFPRQVNALIRHVKNENKKGA